MTAQAKGSLDWEEQPGSPRVVPDADGVVTVTRTLVKQLVLSETDIKTKLATYDVGSTPDNLYLYAILETATGAKNGTHGTINLTYRGRPTGFVEMSTSPQERQKSDGTWIIPRRYIGPKSEATDFVKTWTKGAVDDTYQDAFLETKSITPAGVALSIVELSFAGTKAGGDGGDDYGGSFIDVSRVYTPSQVTFSPWSKGGFQTGPSVTGFYFRETVTVNYVQSAEPTNYSHQSQLTNGSKTYILSWTPSSFDPTCAPHNLEKVKRLSNLSTRKIAQGGGWQVSESHEWIIQERPGLGTYNPP